MHAATVKKSSKKIKEAAVSTGLVINESKTKYMKISRNKTYLEQDLIMNLPLYEWVRNYRILCDVIYLKN
jgi:hypothetical protein